MAGKIVEASSTRDISPKESCLQGKLEQMLNPAGRHKNPLDLDKAPKLAGDFNSP
jgi:hypothetical protein